MKLQICLIKNHFLCFLRDILIIYIFIPTKCQQKANKNLGSIFGCIFDEFPEGTAMCILSNKIFGSRELRKVTYPFRSNCPLEFCKCAIAWYTSCGLEILFFFKVEFLFFNSVPKKRHINKAHIHNFPTQAFICRSVDQTNSCESVNVVFLLEKVIENIIKS